MIETNLTNVQIPEHKAITPEITIGQMSKSCVWMIVPYGVGCPFAVAL